MGIYILLGGMLIFIIIIGIFGISSHHSKPASGHRV